MTERNDEMHEIDEINETDEGRTESQDRNECEGEKKVEWALDELEILDYEQIKERARARGEDVDGDIARMEARRAERERGEQAPGDGSGDASGDDVEDPGHARALRVRGIVERRAERLERPAARLALARLLERTEMLDDLSCLTAPERAALDIRVRLAVGPQEASRLRREIDSRVAARELKQRSMEIERQNAQQETRGVRNHTVFRTVNQKGKTVEIVTALDPEEIELAILDVNEEFPKRIGDQLFVDDGEDGIDFLTSRHALFRWFLEETAGGVFWRLGRASDDRVLMTQEEAFSLVTRMAECVLAIEEHPLWPVPEGVYLTRRASRELPEVHVALPGEGSDESRIGELVGYFNPADAASYALIEALLLTMVWGGSPGARPLFVVTGPRGAGKSTLVRMIARLVGGCAQVDVGHGRTGEPLGEQILADMNLTRRVVLLDNAEGYLRSPELAQWITAEEIEARPKFAQRRRRLNLLTYVATVVDPSLDSDLAARSVVLSLLETRYTPRWEAEVDAFLVTHGDEILAEALARLQRAGERSETLDVRDERGMPGEASPGDASPGDARDEAAPTGPQVIEGKGTRFPRWDAQVLAATSYPQAVLDALGSSHQTVNEDLENLARFLDLLREEWKPEMKPKELTAVWNEANTSRVNTGWCMRTLRAHRRRGQLSRGLRPKWEAANGSPWLVDPSQLWPAGESEVAA